MWRWNKAPPKGYEAANANNIHDLSKGKQWKWDDCWMSSPGHMCVFAGIVSSPLHTPWMSKYFLEGSEHV